MHSSISFDSNSFMQNGSLVMCKKRCQGHGNKLQIIARLKGSLQSPKVKTFLKRKQSIAGVFQIHSRKSCSSERLTTSSLECCFQANACTTADTCASSMLTKWLVSEHIQCLLVPHDPVLLMVKATLVHRCCALLSDNYCSIPFSFTDVVF